MNLIISILLIPFGVIIFYVTYKDGKKRKVELTTGYIMHLKGYFAGVGFFIMGLMMLFKMELLEIVKLLIPLLGVIIGFYIKETKSKNFTSVKKYWIYLVIVCLLLFLFRLFRYLKMK